MSDITRIGRVTFRMKPPFDEFFETVVREDGQRLYALFQLVFAGANRVIYRRVA